jgi:hypothetical protein
MDWNEENSKKLKQEVEWWWTGVWCSLATSVKGYFKTGSRPSSLTFKVNPTQDFGGFWGTTGNMAMTEDQIADAMKEKEDFFLWLPGARAAMYSAIEAYWNKERPSMLILTFRPETKWKSAYEPEDMMVTGKITKNEAPKKKPNKRHRSKSMNLTYKFGRE